MRTVSLLFLLWAPLTVMGQHEDEDVVRVHVESLFDAMRAGDANAVRAHFHPELATLYSVSLDEHGAVEVVSSEIDRFATAVGNAPPGVLDEHLGPIEVRIDGDLATAYMPYAFFLGERFSHCGVNAFHVVRTADGWRTVHISDTRRATDCDPSVEPRDSRE